MKVQRYAKKPPMLNAVRVVEENYKEVLSFFYQKGLILTIRGNEIHGSCKSQSGQMVYQVFIMLFGQYICWFDEAGPAGYFPSLESWIEDQYEPRSEVEV